MTSYLARLAKGGLARETTQYTYLAPTASVPFNTAAFEDIIQPVQDESVRANDTVVQGIQQGLKHATGDLVINGYPDLIGHWLVGMGLFDTVTAGVSTTLASNSTANATTISLTATVAANSVLSVSDTAGANQEYVKISTVTGTGPYTATVAVGGGTGGNTTKYAHTAAGSSVVSQATHTFKQNRSFTTTWPTYSWTFDVGADQVGWPGCVMSDLAVKIDPKNLITFAPKYTGMPSAAQSTFAYAAAGTVPHIGWEWTLSNAAAASTRGLTFDLALKRAVDPIAASTGTQAPREIFPGALEANGTLKAIYDSAADMTLFTSGLQEAATVTATQNPVLGGSVLTMALSLAAYTTGKRDLAQAYVQADYAIVGVTNTTDSTSGGVASATLTNFQQTAY